MSPPVTRRQLLGSGAFTGASLGALAFGLPRLAALLPRRDAVPALWVGDVGAGELVLLRADLSVAVRHTVPGLRRLFGTTRRGVLAARSAGAGHELLELPGPGAGEDGGRVFPCDEAIQDAVPLAGGSLLALTDGHDIRLFGAPPPRESGLHLQGMQCLHTFASGPIASGRSRLLRFRLGTKPGILGMHRPGGVIRSSAANERGLYLLATRDGDSELSFVDRYLRRMFAVRLPGKAQALSVDGFGNAWTILGDPPRLARISGTGRIEVGSAHELPRGAHRLAWFEETLFVGLWGAVVSFPALNLIAREVITPFALQRPVGSRGGFARVGGLVEVV